MTNQVPHASRPIGPIILAALCAVYGLQSLAGAIRLFPFWLAAAKQGHRGSGAFAWVELLSAVSALMAAYGLWHRRRWARLPFLVCVVLGLATLSVIALFGVGETGGTSAWVFVGLVAAVSVGIAGWLTWYVWRST